MATLFAIWAGAAPAAPGAGMTMLPLLLLIPIFYFLMIRPQQKRQKQWQSMLSSIKSGDRITTAGGIRGIILSIKDDVDHHSRGARQHQAGSGQERHCLGDHAGDQLRPREALRRLF